MGFIGDAFPPSPHLREGLGIFSLSSQSSISSMGASSIMSLGLPKRPHFLLPPSWGPGFQIWMGEGHKYQIAAPSVLIFSLHYLGSPRCHGTPVDPFHFPVHWSEWDWQVIPCDPEPHTESGDYHRVYDCLLEGQMISCHVVVVLQSSQSGWVHHRF